MTLKGIAARIIVSMLGSALLAAQSCPVWPCCARRLVLAGYHVALWCAAVLLCLGMMSEGVVHLATRMLLLSSSAAACVGWGMGQLAPSQAGHQSALLLLLLLMLLM
jgi:hypothetical protein